MAEHPINGLMGVTMDKIRELVNSDTIIGEPVSLPDGTTILPVSKVTFGVATGGSDFAAKQSKELFGGGSGAEHLGHTGQAFLVGSLGVGEVFAVGLGFTGESSHQVFESLAHCGSPWGVYVQKSLVLIRNDSCLQKTHAFVKHFFAYFYFRPQ